MTTTTPPGSFSVPLQEHKSLPQNKAGAGSNTTNFKCNISPVPYATSTSWTGNLTSRHEHKSDLCVCVSELHKIPECTVAKFLTSSIDSEVTLVNSKVCQ
jgi:hypothetical protein